MHVCGIIVSGCERKLDGVTLRDCVCGCEGAGCEGRGSELLQQIPSVA